MKKLIPWWVLALAFVVVPVIEIYLLIQVGQAIGPWWTILLLIAADGALILIGGTLLLTPGFLSDVVGAFAILPVTRPIARRLLTRVITRKLAAGSSVYVGGTGRSRQRPGDDDSVIPGEVVNE